MVQRRQMLQHEQNEQIKEAFFLSSLMVAILVMGFVAVQHICPDTSERGKNTRLGL